MLFDHLEDEDDVELLAEEMFEVEEESVGEVMGEGDMALDEVEDTTDRYVVLSDSL